MPNKWKSIAKNAAETTDEQLKNQLSGLSRLKDKDIQDLIDEGISKKDLTSVLAEVKRASASNSKKAEAIKNINNGVEVLVGIIAKLI